MENVFFRELFEKGILTDKNEIEEIKTRAGQLSSSEDPVSISFTILPAMGCNFGCPYCVERGFQNNSVMNTDTQIALAKFCFDVIERAKPKVVAVNWYGGEPLLTFTAIKNLSRLFLAFCNRKKILYTSFLTTNGYLLNQEIVEQFGDLKIDAVRVTLDGGKKSHDRVRVLKGGEGTYDVILKNLKNIKTDIPIEIRCNVSKNVLPYIKDLKKDVRKLKKKKNVSLHFARMLSYDSCDAHVSDSALFEKEFSDFCINSGDDKINLNPSFAGVPCGACNSFSFCFDSEGNIFKCNGELGRKERILGNVNDVSGFEKIKNPSDIKPFPEEKECLECKLLPVCLGSCPLSSVIYGAKRCDRFKNNLDEYVKMIAGLNLV